jgi:DNA-binding NtrC family response regulator
MAAQTLRDRSAAPQSLSGQTSMGTVLVLDDEEIVRQCASMVLQRAGYIVLKAETPAEALHLADWHRGTIHLLLSDVSLGTMTGPFVAEHIRLAHPKMAVLFYSGYSREDLTGAWELPPDAAFLSKPFSSADLLGRVRDLLAETEQKSVTRQEQPFSRDTIATSAGARM